MWLVVLALPFFFLGMQVRSWRAPVYTLGIWLGLFFLWLAGAAMMGQVESGSGPGNGGNLFLGPDDGDALLVVGAVVVAVSMVASYLGAVAGVLLAPKPGGAERRDGDGDSQ